MKTNRGHTVLRHDRGIDTMPPTRHSRKRTEWYMVHDHVGSAPGAPESAHLCISCLEQRSGRPLRLCERFPRTMIFLLAFLSGLLGGGRRRW
jgi:hypothetical protein